MVVGSYAAEVKYPITFDLQEVFLMANIKSKQKRVLTNEKARLRNKSVRSAVRTEIRKFRTLVEAGDKAGAEAQLRTASRALDKSVSKDVFHRNTAANKKSGMAAAFNKMN